MIIRTHTCDFSSCIVLLDISVCKRPRPHGMAQDQTVLMSGSILSSWNSWAFIQFCTEWEDNS